MAKETNEREIDLHRPSGFRAVSGRFQGGFRAIVEQVAVQLSIRVASQYL